MVVNVGKLTFNNNFNIMAVEQLTYLQCEHEEADTPIAFHVAALTGNIVLKTSDSDMIVILLGMLWMSSR